MKPITTEKAVKLIELNNTLVMRIEKEMSKPRIKEEIEELFKVKVSHINTLIRKNKKYAYITLDKKNPAIDVATTLGIM
jgi:ribosomal protein L23